MQRPAQLAARTIEWLLTLLLPLYLGLVLVQVVCRYVLNASLFWAEEVIRHGFVWSLLLASCLVAYRHGHLRLEGVAAWLPCRAARVVARLADALTIAFLAAVLFAGIDLVVRTAGQKSASLELPIWVVYAAIPVGAALEILLTLARAPEDSPQSHADPSL